MLHKYPRNVLAFPCGKMHDLPKISKKTFVICPKLIKQTVLETFNLPKVKKMTKITCLKLIKDLVICLTLVDM